MVAITDLHRSQVIKLKIYFFSSPKLDVEDIFEKKIVYFCQKTCEIITFSVVRVYFIISDLCQTCRSVVRREVGSCGQDKYQNTVKKYQNHACYVLHTFARRPPCQSHNSEVPDANHFKIGVDTLQTC